MSKLPESVEDILESPTKFGLPSFDEFRRKPEHYMEKFFGREDEQFALVDRGSSLLREAHRHEYFIEGYRAKNLEEVERLAKNMGISPRELEIRPDVERSHNGKYKIVVRFFSKESLKRREGW